MKTQTFTSKEANSLFCAAIGGATKSTSRSRVAIRRQIRDAQIQVLRSAIEEIRRKAREMPAWAAGYNSAVTALEIQIKAIGNGE